MFGGISLYIYQLLLNFHEWIIEVNHMRTNSLPNAKKYIRRGNERPLINSRGQLPGGFLPVWCHSVWWELDTTVLICVICFDQVFCYHQHHRSAVNGSLSSNGCYLFPRITFAIRRMPVQGTKEVEVHRRKTKECLGSQRTDYSVVGSGCNGT